MLTVTTVPPQNVKQLLPTAVQGALAVGDLLYWSGTDFNHLAAGSSGQVLTSGGPATAPAWAAGGTSGGAVALQPTATQIIQLLASNDAGSPLRIQGNNAQQQLGSSGDQGAVNPLLDIVGGSIRISSVNEGGSVGKPARFSVRPVTGYTVPIIYPDQVGAIALDLCPRSSASSPAGSQAGLSNQDGGVTWIDMGATDYVNAGGNYRALRIGMWLDGHASIGLETAGLSNQPGNGQAWVSNMNMYNTTLAITGGKTDTITSGWAFAVQNQNYQTMISGNNNTNGGAYAVSYLRSFMNGSRGATLYAFGPSAGTNAAVMGSAGLMFESQSVGTIWNRNDSASVVDVIMGSNSPTRVARFTLAGSTVLGTNALGAGATDGFLYVAAMNGSPSGTPTAQGSSVPLVVDTANQRLWANFGGTWKSVAFS